MSDFLLIKNVELWVLLVVFEMSLFLHLDSYTFITENKLQHNVNNSQHK